MHSLDGSYSIISPSIVKERKFYTLLTKGKTQGFDPFTLHTPFTPLHTFKPSDAAYQEATTPDRCASKLLPDLLG